MPSWGSCRPWRPRWSSPAGCCWRGARVPRPGARRGGDEAGRAAEQEAGGRTGQRASEVRAGAWGTFFRVAWPWIPWSAARPSTGWEPIRSQGPVSLSSPSGSSDQFIADGSTLPNPPHEVMAQVFYQGRGSKRHHPLDRKWRNEPFGPLCAVVTLLVVNGGATTLGGDTTHPASAGWVGPDPFAQRRTRHPRRRRRRPRCRPRRIGPPVPAPASTSPTSRWMTRLSGRAPGRVVALAGHGLGLGRDLEADAPLGPVRPMH